MSIAAPEPKANMGQPIPRYDAVAKVTGAAQYAADVPLNRPAYAYLVTSSVAKGRIDGFDLAAARQVRGAIDIVTHENAEKLKEAKLFSNGGYSSTTIQPLKSADIAQEGQIVAVVLAETYEAAREAAHLVKVSYTESTPTSTFDSPGTTSAAAKGQLAQFKDDPHVGDFAKAFDQAEVKLSASYETPPQHHNPMELFATSCVWNGDSLTIYEPSQYVYGLKNGVAEQLGIDPDKVRVINAYVGGAFGSKGSMTPRTAIMASIARRLGRPVKLVATRDQGFTIATYRAETRHQIQLGAGRDGRLTALRHEGAGSRRGLTPMPSAGPRPRLGFMPAECGKHGVDRARGSQYARLHAFAAGSALYVRAGERDGRTCGPAQHGSHRTAPHQRHHEGTYRRQAVYLALADGLLRRRREVLRMGESQQPAEIHVGRRLADRIWLRHHLLSHTNGPGGGARSPAARRPHPGRNRRPRDRQWRLHRDWPSGR
jgi:hypothetical protein